jgi:hypothetical protein
VPRPADANGHGAPGDGRAAAALPLPSIWLSVVVEEACLQIWQAWDSGTAVTSLRVSPAVYDAVAAGRPGEVRRGYPLMLLGLPLVADQAVATYEPVVVRSARAAPRA